MKNVGLKYYTNVLLKGSLAVSLAHASTKVIGIVLLPVFTYYLSPEEYGLASMVMVVVSFFGLIYNPGIISATTRLYYDTNNEQDKQELIGSAFSFFLLFPIVISILAFIIGPFVFPVFFSDFQFYPYGILAILLGFFTQPNRIWILLMTLNYKIHITAFYTAISVLIGSGVALVLVIVFKLGALGKVLAMFPPAFFMFFISFRAIKKYSKGKWSITSIKKQLVMGLPLLIAIWSYEVLHIADRYILERMTDITQVGLYSFGYTVAQAPLFLVLGIRQLWNPIFYDNMNKNDFETVSKLISIYVIFLSTICIIVVLFSKEAIILLINERYHDAIPVIGLIVVGIYFSALLTITNSFLGFEKRFGTTSKIALVAALSNIILNIILIPTWGIIGSALATAISYLVYLLIGIVNVKVYLRRVNFLLSFLYSSIYITAAYAFLAFFNTNGMRSLEIIIKVFFLIIYISGFLILRIVKVSDLKKIKSLIRKK